MHCDPQLEVMASRHLLYFTVNFTSENLLKAYKSELLCSSSNFKKQK